ncbi:hypothetical protein FOA52_009636 [Chlamydomonas sp. UWO 241]|nr:hypothetical protein FOA52_009636 [Chlamydomonas sp. UWO 241]
MSSSNSSPGTSPLDSHESTGPGALRPLLCLLSESDKPERALAYLDTLDLLLHDVVNLSGVRSLGGTRALLRVLRRFARHGAVVTRCLYALVRLSRGHDDVKAELWAAEGCGDAVLRLLVQSGDHDHPSATVEVLGLVSELAFGHGAAPPTGQPQPQQRLLCPQLVRAAASLLHPAADAEVASAALKLLTACARVATREHAPEWRAAALRLVPLLVPPGSCICTLQQQQEQQHDGGGPVPPTATTTDGPRVAFSPQADHSAAAVPMDGLLGRRSLGRPAALVVRQGPPHALVGGVWPSPPRGSCVLLDTMQLLLTLASRPATRCAPFAAGCAAPAVQLLTHPLGTVRVAACCLLAAGLEDEFAAAMLAGEGQLAQLVHALGASGGDGGGGDADVEIGVLYVLARLAASRASARAWLARADAAARVASVAAAAQDLDVSLACQQLLCVLSSSSGGVAGEQVEEEAAGRPPVPALSDSVAAGSTGGATALPQPPCPEQQAEPHTGAAAASGPEEPFDGAPPPVPSPRSSPALPAPASITAGSLTHALALSSRTSSQQMGSSGGGGEAPLQAACAPTRMQPHGLEQNAIAPHAMCA